MSIDLHIIGLVFIILKLCGVISWSWWFVTLPFWIFPAMVTVVMMGLIVFLIAVGLIALVLKLFDR